MRQRLMVLLISATVITAVHFAYPHLRPEWIIYHNAEKDFQKKEWIAAANSYESAFKSGLKYPLAMTRLAHAYVEMKDYPEASRWYAHYLKLHPEADWVRRAYAGTLSAQGSFDLAAEQYAILLGELPRQSP